jgi:hypothetical protein
MLKKQKNSARLSHHEYPIHGRVIFNQQGSEEDP